MSYESKCMESFETKLNIFLFTKCINYGLDGLSVDDFSRYEITDEDIEVYAAVYYQLLLTDSINSLSVAEVDQKIKTWKSREADLLNQMREDYKHRFKGILSHEKFNKVAEGDKCQYCQITLNDINDLIDQKKIFKKSGRGFNMEIDRKSSNKEYSTGNVVTCCYWCNNAKTDEFTEDEFRPIADGIREVWVKRGIERLRKRA